MTTLVETFSVEDLHDNEAFMSESIGEEISRSNIVAIAGRGHGGHGSVPSLSPSPLPISRPMSEDELSLADNELEVLELPPELGWLGRATSLPGAVLSEHDDQDSAELHDSLHSGIECTVQGGGGMGGRSSGLSGFSRPDSRCGDQSGLLSRASTPESIVADFSEHISQQGCDSNASSPERAPPPPARSKGKRAFVLPPRPQHGTTRPKGMSSGSAQRNHHNNAVDASSSSTTPAPTSGTFASMTRPWSWRRQQQ